MIDLYQIAGFVGVAFYLGSYALLQLGVVRGNGYVYALMNLAGASLILMSLLAEWNLFSAIIQISWITLSVIGIARVWILTQTLRFTDEERALIDAHFPTLGRIEAKRLMRAGQWRDLDVSDRLTEQAQPVTTLSYIHAGGVDIFVNDQTIAQVGQGGFIGEMGCMASAPASATVAINQPSRVFQVPSDALRRLVKRDPDFGAHLEFAFAGNTRAKLIATNVALEEKLRAQSAVAEAR